MQALLLPFTIAGCWKWMTCPFEYLSSCRNDNNWINHDHFIIDVNNVASVIIRSIYFVQQSFTTVGFDYILPQNKNEVCFCILLSVFSMLFWNGFNSLVVSCIKWFNYNSLAISDEVAILRSWLSLAFLPATTERVMLSHKLHPDYQLKISGIVCPFLSLLGPATFSLLIAHIVNFIFAQDIIIFVFLGVYWLCLSVLSKDKTARQLHNCELHRMHCIEYLRKQQLDDSNQENQLLANASTFEEYLVLLTNFEVDVARTIANSNLGN